MKTTIGACALLSSANAALTLPLRSKLVDEPVTKMQKKLAQFREE